MASFVALLLTSGATSYVNPDTVDEVADIVPSVPPACTVSFTSEGTTTRLSVDGTAAATVALLSAGGGGSGVSDGSYLPSLVSAPTAPLIGAAFSSGNFRYINGLVGGGVYVWGKFDVTTDGSAGTGAVIVSTPAGFNAATLTATLGAVSAVDQTGVTPLQVIFKGTGATGGLMFEVTTKVGQLGGTIAFSGWYEKL